MTRREYEAIAKIFKKSLVQAKGASVSAWIVVKVLIQDFVAMLIQDNAGFRQQKFLKACGYEEGYYEQKATNNTQEQKKD